MNYHSEFTKNESEYIFQQLEEIAQHAPENTHYLIEEIGENQVLLKVKIQDMLFEVDSTADSIIIAVRNAKEKVIQMILNRTDFEDEAKEVAVLLN